jgi:AraC-like DNA-binding protein
VAKPRATSVRTLSRKLADEGGTYAEVVDQLRRSLAFQYLKDRGMSLAQIAWLLGYEGSTSFNHAFKRWTGQSPSAARNQKLLPWPESGVMLRLSGDLARKDRNLASGDRRPVAFSLTDVDDGKAGNRHGPGTTV